MDGGTAGTGEAPGLGVGIKTHPAVLGMEGMGWEWGLSPPSALAFPVGS